MALLDEVRALRSLIKREVKNEVDFNEVDFNEEVKQFEIVLIERALEQSGGSQTRAAELLHLKETTLRYKIKRYDIDVESHKIFARAVK